MDRGLFGGFSLGFGKGERDEIVFNGPQSLNYRTWVWGTAASRLQGIGDYKHVVDNNHHHKEVHSIQDPHSPPLPQDASQGDGEQHLNKEHPRIP